MGPSLSKLRDETPLARWATGNTTPAVLLFSDSQREIAVWLWGRIKREARSLREQMRLFPHQALSTDLCWHKSCVLVHVEGVCSDTEPESLLSSLCHAKWESFPICVNVSAGHILGSPKFTFSACGWIVIVNTLLVPFCVEFMRFATSLCSSLEAWVILAAPQPSSFASRKRTWNQLEAETPSSSCTLFSEPGGPERTWLA